MSVILPHNLAFGPLGGGLANTIAIWSGDGGELGYSSNVLIDNNDSMLDVTCKDVNTSALKLELFSGQTANVLEINSDGGSGGDLVCINNKINIGLGSSLRDWDNTIRCMQFGDNLSIFSFDIFDTIGMAQGMYYNDSKWKYCETGVPASLCDLNSGYVVLHTIGAGTADDTISVSAWKSLYLDYNGNFGLNFLPQSDCWNNLAMMQLGGNATINATDASGANGALYIGQNMYIDNSPAYKYISNDEASLYAQTNGTHSFATAVAGSGNVTLDVRLKIMNDGTVGIGTISPNAMLDIACKDANTSGIKIKAAVSQTEDLFKIVDSNNDILFVINNQGDIGVTIDTPNEPLHVQSDYDGNRAIRIGNESSGTSAVGRFIVDVLGGSAFLAGYGSNFTTSGSKRANSGSLITNASMAGGLSMVARHPTTGHLRFYSGGNADANQRMIIQADGQIAINATSADAMLDITCKDVNTSALKISAYASQEEDLINITDSSDNTIAKITSGGKIQTNRGVRAISNSWGDSFSGWPSTGSIPEHEITNNAGYYDWTGNANGDNLFYDTVNSPFTQADVDNRNWIVIRSGAYKGAKTEIIEYIDASNVIIGQFGACWTSDLSGVNYDICIPPQFIASDCYSTHVHIGRLGGLHIANCGGTLLSDIAIEIDSEIGKDSADTLNIFHNANGFNDSDTIHIFYKTGDLQTNDHNNAFKISINEIDATDGHIDGVFIETTTISSAEKEGIHIGSGFTNAISVSGSSVIDPDYGYEITTTTVVDRVNSGGGGDDAFVNQAVNQTLFDNDNDYILIGSDNTFEVIEIILNTISSKDLLLNFYYSKAGGNWAQFYPNDGTLGFTQSGIISFTAPGDWTKDDEAEANSDITDAYYIKIVRTYNSVVPTLPIESYFKTIEDQAGDTGMLIRGDGSIKLPYLTGIPSSPVNGLIWMENDGLHLYYNGAEKIVAGV